MSTLNFDATTVQPIDDFSPVPAGEYIVAITDSEMKATKSGNGEYLQIEMQVLDGQYKGRKIWDRLNLVNQNEIATRIAKSTLSSICHATGKLQVQNSEELHDIPMVVKIAVRPADGQYDSSNVVKAYKKIIQKQQTQQAQQDNGQQPAQQATQQATSNSDDLPW